MNILKGIGAVLAGMIFIVVTHTVTDLVLEKVGIFTPPEQGFHITWMVVRQFGVKTSDVESIIK